MTVQYTSVSEDFLRDLMESESKWMDAAQTLAYLVDGINGMGADDTLRLGHFRLGKLFEDLYHDAMCWDSIANRDDSSPYTRTFARDRARALREIADRAYQRFETRTEGRTQESHEPSA